jgi:hypothetical protein
MNDILQIENLASGITPYVSLILKQENRVEKIVNKDR